jgi:hypothetical protein
MKTKKSRTCTTEGGFPSEGGKGNKQKRNKKKNTFGRKRIPRKKEKKKQTVL